MQDDFADGQVDWDLWEIGYGPASEAPCAGIECARKENVSVEDGRLVLTTTPEGADEIPNDVWLAEYTTGAVSTASSFHQQFGYFEAKAKIPIQPGALPAFWAWSADGNPPEIDFYEAFGDSSELSFGMPVDCNDNGEFIGTGTSYEPDAPVDSTFHVIGTAWTPEYVAWYVDGQEIHREDGFYVEECHTPEPMYPMLNTYVLDEDSWAGDEVIGDHTEAAYPYTHEFEWVRVWQRDDLL